MKFVKLIFVLATCAALLPVTISAQERSADAPVRHVVHPTRPGRAAHPMNRPVMPARKPVQNVMSRPTPALPNTPHHGPNPPVVGGPTNSNANRSGALNGTAIKRKR